MNIKFNGDGRDYKGGLAHDSDLVHADGAIQDYTLCGLTLDGDSATCGDWKTTREKITCSQCIDIIKHCKSIRL